MLSVAEQLLYSTVRIEGYLNNGQSSVGTGFFYKHEDRVFVVTNKHVIEGMQQGYFYLNQQDENNDEKPDYSKEKLTINFTSSSFYGHPNPEVDVAIMNVSSGLVGLHNQGFTPFYSQTTVDIIPTTEIIEKTIDSLEEIVFVGYPNGIWDSINNLPIMRKGITATPFFVDFMGQPQFLIDASVFPGSSGSPVFAYRSGAFKERDGTLKYGDKIYLLGIVAKVYQRLEEGQILIKDVPTNHVPYTQVKQMIDLGIVFKATTIIETIAHFYHVNQIQK